MINFAARALKLGNSHNGYFKGNATACKEAYDFFNAGDASDPQSEGLKSAGGAKNGHHIIGFYGVAEDGTKYKYSGTLSCSGNAESDYSNFKTLYNKHFNAWVDIQKKHKLTAAAEFAVKNTAGDRLEATEKTAGVAVPFIRTVKTDVAENDTFVAKYPDGTAVTNALNWAAGDTTRTIAVGVTGKWQAGKAIALEIRDSNGTVFRRSEIHCVKAVNSFGFPDLEFDPAGEWGRWTLDSEANRAAALEKVYAANSYRQADTNDNPEVEVVRPEIVGDELTNRTFYVQLPGCVTNEDVSAREILQGAVECTNYYYSVATNTYQHGALGWAEGGRDASYTQAFVLKVTGGAVWQPETLAFATAVFDQPAFTNWCAIYHVVTLLEECSDPKTGASLFSRTVAANGRSGAAFLSRNGLEPGCVQPPASNVFEIALYRPDGTLAAVLTPQCKDGVYDLSENILRLMDLTELAEDLTEPGNNDPTTTTLEAIYGQTVMTDPSATLHWVDINDKKDVFRLVDVPAGEYVSIKAVSDPATRYNEREKPQVKVWRYADKTKASTQVIAPVSVDADGNPVWKFAEADLRDGGVDLLYADVTAWTAAYAATEKFGGLTDFTYPLTVTAADPYPGTVGFDVTSETYEAEPEGDKAVELQVTRTGYTGGALVRLSLDTASTTVPLDRIAWAHGENNATNLVWAAGESGTKTVSVTVRNVSWEDSVSNLVFRLSHNESATLAEGREMCTFGIQQEDDSLANTGVIYISDPVPAAGEKIWTKCNPGNPIEIKVMRDRVDGKARGEATARLTVVGGAQLSTNELKWVKGAKTGTKSVGLWLDQVGASGQQQVVVTVTGTDVDGNAMHDATRNTLTYVFVPTDAPEFAYPDVPTAYQYASYEAKVLLQDYYPTVAEISELTCLEGVLPEGLTAKIIDEELKGGSYCGGFRIAGKPTKVCSAKLVYQLTLKGVANKENPQIVKTIPVTIWIDVKPLGENENAIGPDGELVKPVIPGFATRRVWQYLPLARKVKKNVQGPEKYEVCGVLNLSASPKGSVSARYTTQGKTVSFAAPMLDSVREDNNDGFGGYVAEVRMERGDFKLNVQFGANDRVVARLTTPGGEDLSFASDANTVTWKKLKGAALWNGRYTVAFEKDGAGELPDAEGTAALAISMTSPSMTANGVVKYTGVLPNGKPISGTSMLLAYPGNENCVKLPIYWTSATDVFSAILVLRKTGETKAIESDDYVTSYWRSDGKGHDLSVVGASFDAQDWANVKPAEESLILNRTSGIVSGLHKGKHFRGVALTDKTREGKKFIMGTAWSTVDDGQGGAKRKAEAVEIEVQ